MGQKGYYRDLAHNPASVVDNCLILARSKMALSNRTSQTTTEVFYAPYIVDAWMFPDFYPDIHEVTQMDNEGAVG